jgi:hypothetical protein
MPFSRLLASRCAVRLPALASFLLGATALAAGPAAALLTFDDPAEYRPPTPGIADSVVYLTFEPAGEAQQSCTGTLVAGETHIITAAHCLTDFDGTVDVPWVDVHFEAAGVTMRADFDALSIPDGWLGLPSLTPDDIAMIELPGPAPAGLRGLEPAPADIDFEDPLTVWLFGYGYGGLGGVDPGLMPGVLRAGFNHYDDPSALDPWQGFFNVFDFDDYTEGSNIVGEPGWVTYPGNPPIQSIPQVDYDFDRNWVLGESMTASGDSGGPSVVDIYLVGVHSWVQPGLGGDVILLEDAPGAMDIGFGWIAGDTSVAAHADWIQGVLSGTTIPEPSTGVLLGVALSGALSVGRRGARRRGAPIA